jgi:3-oxoacyl-ACP reductase-like protein
MQRKRRDFSKIFQTARIWELIKAATETGNTLIHSIMNNKQRKEESTLHNGTFRDRVVVVAGATRGAGRGIATAFGEAGATVICTGRSTTGEAQ